MLPVRDELLEAAAARLCPPGAALFDSLRRGGRRRGHRGHGGVRHPWVLHHPQEGPAEPAADLVDVLQPAEAAQLPEEEHAPGQAALRHLQQHRLRAVIKETYYFLQI